MVETAEIEGGSDNEQADETIKMKPSTLGWAAALLLVASGIAQADKAEWICEPYDNHAGDSLRLMGDYESKTGTVSLAGMPKMDTQYGASGLDRSWLWTEERQTDDPLVMWMELGPDGIAELHEDIGSDDKFKIGRLFPKAKFRCTPNDGFFGLLDKLFG